MNHSFAYPASAGCIQPNITTAQKTGLRHLQQNKPCEDVIYLRQTRNLLFYGLADGQSQTLCGAEGGRACLEAVADYIENTGISNILHAPFPDELPCMFVKQIRRRILSMVSSQNIDFKEYASTLLALAIDPATGEYLLAHLGDGYAIGISQDHTLRLLSPPDNGVTAHHTWLTTSDNAVSHLRISFGSIKSKKRLLLMSDGAVCFCRGKNIPRQAKELLQTGTEQEIIDHLYKTEVSDDASCIIVDLEPKKLTCTFPEIQYNKTIITN